MATLLESFATKKLLDTGYTLIQKSLEKIDGFLVSDRTEFETAISHHLNDVEIWSRDVELRDLRSHRHLDNVFVPLDTYLSPRNNRQDCKSEPERIKLEEALSQSEKNAILLGQPGAGKTTSAKHICRQLLTDSEIFESSKFPICLRFRDLSPLLPRKENPEDPRILGGIIVPWLLTCFGIKQDSESPLALILARVQYGERLVAEILNHFSPLIVFEGFDEIVTDAAKKRVLSEIQSLSNKLNNARFILTSRIGDFPYAIGGCDIYQISDLNKDQIIHFSKTHLEDETEQQDFVNQIENSPFFDTTIRPLTLVWLCAVYRHSKCIPEKPKTVYRKIVNLLLQEWDEERNVTRQSKYAGFQPDRKFEFLSRLSYDLTISFKRDVFLELELRQAYETICEDYDLPKHDSKCVIREIESHSGLITQESNYHYSFAHKSIQEYLTADFIVRSPKLPRLALIQLLPNELAIAISLSSSPSQFLENLIDERLLAFSSKAKNFGFLRIFLARLIQERAEFDASRNLIRSLVSLYSSYLTAGHTAQQRMLFYDDVLVFEFESLMESACKRNTRFNPFSDYEERESVLGWEGAEIVRLVRKSTTSSKSSQFLANDLMCRRTFLDHFTKKTKQSETSSDNLL